MSDPQKNALNIAFQALDLESSERDGFLRQASGEDADLFAEVQSLLARVDRVDGFLEHSFVAFLSLDQSNVFDEYTDANDSEAHRASKTDILAPNQALEPSPSHSSLPTIPGYELMEELGRGGMGVVYKARQTQAGRIVALKMVLAQTGPGEELRERFYREARAVARLQHPGIVQIFDVGEHAGVPFFSLELCSYGSLDRYLSRTPVAARDAAQLVANLAKAIEAAHQANVVHRDLKPANILLTLSGEKLHQEADANKSSAKRLPLSDLAAKVTDFGLAKQLDSVTRTRTGVLMGTPSYMAPEQAAGDAEVGPPADIYALGAILYECLTGRPPFNATTSLETILQVTQNDPVPPRQLQPGLPRDLETIVLKAMNKDPKTRYASAKDLADDLQRFLDDSPVRARRPTIVERTFRWTRRKKSLAASFVVVGLLVTMLTVISTAAWVRESALRQSESQQRLLAEKRGEEISDNRDRIKRQLYFSQMTLASHGAGESYGADTMKARLAEWLPERAGVDLRGWEWYYLYSLVHREHFVSKKLGHWTWSVDFTPDGKTFAAGVNATGYKIWDTTTGRLIRNKQTRSMRAVAYSPDGKRLATTGFAGTARVWRVSDGEELVRLSGHTGRVVYAIAWSPDGKRLVTCSEFAEDEHMLRVWDATTGDEIYKLDGHLDTVRAVGWSPDGSRLASASYDGIVRIWNPTTGQELSSFDTADQLLSLCWSPDGTHLVVGGSTGTIQYWEVDRNVKQDTINTLAGAVHSLAWRPGQAQLASGHLDGTVRLWDMGTKTELTRFYGHTNQLRCVKWTPDGTLLASTGLDQTVRIWNIQSADPQLRLTSVPMCVTVDWGSKGRRLAVCNDEGSSKGDILVWDTKTNKQRVVYSGNSHCHTLAWSPGNRRLAFGGDETPTRVWNASTNQIIALEESDPTGAKSMAWSPTGSQLAIASATGDVTIFNMNSNTKQQTIANAHQRGRFTLVDWSRVSSQLATAGGDGFVKVRNLKTGKPLWQAQRDSHQIFGLRWSPDGKRLATAHYGAIVVWDARNGTKIRTFNEIQEQFWSVDWSPDGTRLVAGSASSLSLWHVDSGRVTMRIPNSGGPIRCVRWEQGGKRIAVSGFYQPVTILDATLGYRQIAPSTED